MMNEPELSGAPLAIFVNKQDIPNAMGVAEVTEKMKLNELLVNVPKDRLLIQAVSGKTLAGVDEAFAWLARAIKTEAPPKATTNVTSEESKPSLLEQWLLVEDDADDVFLEKFTSYRLTSVSH